MINNELVRKLAKSIKHQNILRISKDISSIQIFKNNTDLSAIQDVYLSYLYMYSNIYDELALDKVSPIVLKDNIYTDAFIAWKNSEKHNDSKTTNTAHDVNLVFSNKPLKGVK